ncbi:MAG: hypothetical protein JJ909_16865 [Roseivirga sp.]|uniref:hypothetical protein n=1 Tax=Roseivirga sp. TaxID=1964215 RepID=UPI001B13850C|nr:hypothetical protein [Roseivirga sp.]MBO6659871.1 hypothetical protein [Roseivirga sp.]MBO6762631.1 hypothetical protein [Roseivirga sp.]MBO6907392.1 hypothetical protein [Roseivirga sp.]
MYQKLIIPLFILASLVIIWDLIKALKAARTEQKDKYRIKYLILLLVLFAYLIAENLLE